MLSYHCYISVRTTSSDTCWCRDCTWHLCSDPGLGWCIWSRRVVRTRRNCRRSSSSWNRSAPWRSSWSRAGWAICRIWRLEICLCRSVWTETWTLWAIRFTCLWAIADRHGVTPYQSFGCYPTSLLVLKHRWIWTRESNSVSTVSSRQGC